MESVTAQPQSLVGLVLDSVHYEVEAGKIREFAIASRASDPAHLDKEAANQRGYGRELATATHVVVAGHYRDQRGFVDRLGLDIRRVVVGSTRWEYLRPLVAGDVLNGVRRVVADESKTSGSGSTMRLITLETTYTNIDGHVVQRQREVLIERGRP